MFRLSTVICKFKKNRVQTENLHSAYLYKDNFAFCLLVSSTAARSDASLIFNFQFFILPTAAHMPNKTISVTAMVAPTGAESTSDSKKPPTAAITAKTPANTVTVRKLLNSRIAPSAGKTMSAVMRSEPTNFMPSTITTAAITAVTVLKSDARVPVAVEKLSSNDTVKIRL